MPEVGNDYSFNTFYFFNFLILEIRVSSQKTNLQPASTKTLPGPVTLCFLPAETWLHQNGFIETGEAVMFRL